MDSRELMINVMCGFGVPRMPIDLEKGGDRIMEIRNGNIVVYDESEEYSYGIKQITAEFGEDIHDAIGVVRCTGITIESDAPSEINAKAEDELYNEFADIEYNNADGEERYRREARQAISERSGVDISRIVIE